MNQYLGIAIMAIMFAALAYYIHITNKIESKGLDL
jgi:hypothetical protein